MWSKIGNVTLSIIIVCGGIYFFINNSNNEKLVQTSQMDIQQLKKDNEVEKKLSQQFKEESQSQKAQIQQLQKSLDKSKQENIGLHRNIDDYLLVYDKLIKDAANSGLPVLKYSNEEERKMLLYTKKVLQKNEYKGKEIVPKEDVVTYLEAAKTDNPSVYAVSILTYHPQYPLRKFLPIAADLRFGSNRYINVAKDKNGWRVVGDISIIF